METEKLIISNIDFNPPKECDDLWDLYYRQFDDPTQGILIGRQSDFRIVPGNYGGIIQNVSEKDAWVMYRELEHGRWHVVKSHNHKSVPDGKLFITEQIDGLSFFDGTYNECYDFLKKQDRDSVCFKRPDMDDLRPTLTIKQILGAWLKDRVVEVKEYFRDIDNDELKSTDWHAIAQGSEIHSDDPNYQYRLREEDKSKTAMERIAETEDYIEACHNGSVLDPHTLEVVGHPIDVDEAKVWKDLATELAKTLDKAIDKLKEEH